MKERFYLSIYFQVYTFRMDFLTDIIDFMFSLEVKFTVFSMFSFSETNINWNFWVLESFKGF